MFFGIIDSCLSIINGPFYIMPSAVINSNQYWPKILPYASLYIAFIGIKTPSITFVIVHILFLFRIITKLGITILNFIRKYIPEYKALIFILDLIIGLIILPYGILYGHMFLSHTKFRRSISTIGRTLHAISLLIISQIFASQFSIYVINFLICKTLMFLVIQKYLHNSKMLMSGMFAFIGSYYFLKLVSSCWISFLFLPTGFSFDFSPWEKSMNVKKLLVSYGTLLVFFALACTTQNTLIRRIDKEIKIELI
ncbi:hypothetical protein PAEPH01_0158 [Pancytospora epiphaga]|nr:hypothetical protein PAEPH01_0158 [Pancytospora epiphaga]